MLGSACEHGTCIVDEGFEVHCECKFGYAGRACGTNIFIITLIASLVTTVAVAVLSGVYQYNKRRIAGLTAYSVLQEQLLETSQFELKELEKGWEINDREVQLLSRIDLASEGAFGEVWICDVLFCSQS